jgi:hypothetical protein
MVEQQQAKWRRQVVGGERVKLSSYQKVTEFQNLIMSYDPSK